MAFVLIRLVRVLPILAAIAVIVALLYGVLVATGTRERARRVLVRVLSVIFGAFTVVFALATLYAWTEGNTYVLEVADVSAALFAALFAIVRIAAWRMRHKKKPAAS